MYVCLHRLRVGGPVLTVDDILPARAHPRKQVCYSYWVLSSLAILDKLTWIDSAALTRFILSAQVRAQVFPPVSSVASFFLLTTMLLW